MPTNLLLALLNTLILLGWHLCLDGKKVSPIGFKVVLWCTIYLWSIALFNRISVGSFLFGILMATAIVVLYVLYEKYLTESAVSIDSPSEFKSADDLCGAEIIYVSTLDVQKDDNTEPIYQMIGRTKKGTEIIFYSKDMPQDLAIYVITHTTDKIWADRVEYLKL
jgi:hypothetical protein